MDNHSLDLFSIPASLFHSLRIMFLTLLTCLYAISFAQIDSISLQGTWKDTVLPGTFLTYSFQQFVFKADSFYLKNYCHNGSVTGPGDTCHGYEYINYIAGKFRITSGDSLILLGAFTDSLHSLLRMSDCVSGPKLAGQFTAQYKFWWLRDTLFLNSDDNHVFYMDYLVHVGTQVANPPQPHLSVARNTNSKALFFMVLPNGRMCNSFTFYQLHHQPFLRIFSSR